MLYLIGIGLADEYDISLKGLTIIKKCDLIYLEDYTSILCTANIQDLERLYNKKIEKVSREVIEKTDNILKEAKIKDVALLIVGDVFFATTHTDLYLRAKNENIQVEVIFNASIFNAIGLTGLQLYKFGKITSIVFPSYNYFPTTCYDVLKTNISNGMHTLMLLDIDKEQNKFMTLNEGIKLLLNIEREKKEKIFTESTLCVGCARLGAKDFFIKAGTAKNLLQTDFGKPPHCLIVPAALHFMEEEMLSLWK